MPPTTLQSHTVWIQKGEFTEDTTQVRRKVGALRPITLMQTSGKSVATIANDELSDIASRVVVGNQRGLRRGRQMADNAIEFEGDALAYPKLHARALAGILRDFAQAFPS